MNNHMLYLLQNPNCGKREMLENYLRYRGVIRQGIEELEEPHAAFLMCNFQAVMLRAKAFANPEECFHDVAVEALGGI